MVIAPLDTIKDVVKTFEKMRKIVEELFGVQAKVRFPKIEWK
jgi:hypothetical protein